MAKIDLDKYGEISTCMNCEHEVRKLPLIGKWAHTLRFRSPASYLQVHNICMHKGCKCKKPMPYVYVPKVGDIVEMDYQQNVAYVKGFSREKDNQGRDRLIYIHPDWGSQKREWFSCARQRLRKVGHKMNIRF